MTHHNNKFKQGSKQYSTRIQIKRLLEGTARYAGLLLVKRLFREVMTLLIAMVVVKIFIVDRTSKDIKLKKTNQFENIGPLKKVTLCLKMSAFAIIIIMTSSPNNVDIQGINLSLPKNMCWSELNHYKKKSISKNIKV